MISLQDNLGHKFCSSYSFTRSVRLAIRGKRLFFQRKSQPLRGRILVGASPDGYGKQTVLKPGADGGYDLSMFGHSDQVVILSRNNMTNCLHTQIST